MLSASIMTCQHNQPYINHCCVNEVSSSEFRSQTKTIIKDIDFIVSILPTRDRQHTYQVSTSFHVKLSSLSFNMSLQAISIIRCKCIHVKINSCMFILRHNNHFSRNKQANTEPYVCILTYDIEGNYVDITQSSGKIKHHRIKSCQIQMCNRGKIYNSRHISIIKHHVKSSKHSLSISIS